MEETVSSAVAVLSRVAEDESNWPELLAESRRLLETDGESAAPTAPAPTTVFLHAAATLKTPPQFVAQLGMDPHIVASVSAQLVEDAGVARRQYQRVIGEHTRVLTHDMLAESTEGYARVLRLLTDPTRPEPAEMWSNLLAIAGRFSLEPFKLLTLWITALLDFPSGFDAFADWVASSKSGSAWKRHPDWIAVFELVGQFDDLGSLVAKLCVRGAVDFARVYTKLKPSDSAFDNYERQFDERRPAGGLNALAMAMPLVDDDDEENGEVVAEPDEAEMAVEEPASSTESQPISATTTTSDSEHALHRCFVLLGAVLGELASVSNPEVELAALSIVKSRALAFGTSEIVASGLNKLVASKLSGGQTIDSIKPLLMPHAITEPLWTTLLNTVDLSTSDGSQFFRAFMLPSLDLHANSGATTAKLAESMSTVERYALYTDLATRVAVENSLVKSRFARAEKDTKDVLKRLTRNDAETVIVPQLLAVFARCPWPSLNVFVGQVESYNIGQLVARSASNNSGIAPLAMDMLPLVLMQQFTAAGRAARQKDGLFDQRWFKLLAQFAGDIAAADYGDSFDFVALLRLVLSQFAVEHDFSQTVVAEQLVRTLSGSPPLSNLSVTQFVALSTAEPVASLAAAAITGGGTPQRERLIAGLLTNEENGVDLATEMFAALCFAYNQTVLTGTDAKVVAAELDRISGLVLVLCSLVPPSTTPKNAPREFAHAALRHSKQGHPAGPFAFESLKLYDVFIDQQLYAAVAEPSGDPKSVERAALSHRLRVKSVLQQVHTADTPKPGTADLLSRLVLSPTDALYTSKYVQSAMQPLETVPQLVTRASVLALLKSATPLETESFACFLTDILTHLYSSSSSTANSGEVVRQIHSNVTEAVLEAAFPEAAYTPLANVFSLLQRTLPVFPLYKDQGKAIAARIRLLTAKTHGDLETAVKSLDPQLAKREPLWQEDAGPKPEFVEQLKAHNERLLARFVASIKMLPREDQGDEKAGEPTEELARRPRGKPRSRKRKW